MATRLGAVPEGLVVAEDGRLRCRWCVASALYRDYHDHEWGLPVVDDRRLFEKICLEGFQAGLSWLTILNKRKAFRAGFAQFDAQQMAAFNGSDVKRLLADAGIVRHRGKIESAINNAKRALELQQEFGSVARYVWQFESEPLSRPTPATWAALHAHGPAPEALALSKALKKRGWRFVGPTTMYAFMQAMGMVNDHVEGCHVRPIALQMRAQLAPLSASPVRGV